MCNKVCVTCKHLIHLINENKEPCGFECDKYDTILFTKNIEDLKEEVNKC